MAITLPQFVDKQILTAAQLQSLVTALENKFAAGIAGADLVWPMVAQGNLDMADNDIDNLTQLWAIKNLAERSSGTTVQDVFTTVESAGGGIVLIPANTTISADNLTIGTGTIIMGCGWTSVLAATASTTGFLINTELNDAKIQFINLSIDGSAMSSGSNGLVKLVGSGDVQFTRVRFVGGRAAQIQLTDDGTPGNSCVDVTIDKCKFEQPTATAPNIELLDCQRVRITDCDFIDPKARAVYGHPAATANQCVDVTVSGNNILCDLDNNAAVIEFTSPNATFGVDQSSLHIKDNVIDGQNQASYGRILVQNWQDFKVAGNTIRDVNYGAGGPPAIHVIESVNFKVHNNEIFDYGGDGIGIGSDGYDVAIGSRTANVGCGDFEIHDNLIKSVYYSGIFIVGTTFKLSNNTVLDVNQAAAAGAAAYGGIELWKGSQTFNWDGTIISGNTCRGANQLAGLVTWNNVLGNDGASAARYADIAGAAGVVNITVIGNDIEGVNGGGTPDFTHSTALRCIFLAASNNIT